MSIEIQPQSNPTVLVGDGQTTIVEIVTEGPQGPVAPPFNLGDLPNVEVGAAADKSLLYYDAASEQWRGDAIHTVITLTDGGGF